jgi:small multidrug resistance family-3 protein
MNHIAIPPVQPYPSAYAVNAPPWDFGKLLGVYVSLFFMVAQGVNFVAFGARPDAPTLLGGALIVAGGLIVAFGKFG